MLTRDIDLVDCVLDLLDNSVDGIGELARREGLALDPTQPLAGYRVDISFDKDHFCIRDRSGGIPVDIAQEYAFRFGRPDDAPDLNDGSIGLYGIGMKRAFFKMGNLVSIRSSTGNESFALDLNVDEWRRDPQIQAQEESDGDEGEDEAEAMEWSFDLSDVKRQGTDVEVGTTIEIRELYENVWRQFENPVFRERMTKMIARDYAFILSKGLEVFVNGTPIRAMMPSFRNGAEISPFQHFEVVDGVRIEVTAGLADPPPDDTSATARTPDVAVYGWYVVCNERVVVSADKSSETGWGIKPVPAWHPQFIGFMGVVRFDSDDPRKLPWKTTKRDVESSNEFFQRALPIIMRATKKITDYTNARRAEAKRLKRIEKATPIKPVERVVTNKAAVLPQLQVRDVVFVEYARERKDIEAAAEALGLVGSSPSEVGIRTFEYFLAREVAR